MEKGKNWVDYKALKESVTMEMVLTRYDLLQTLRVSGSSLVGCCPIHNGHNSRQFVVDTEKNIFNCFGNCGGGGNILDFVAKKENVSIRQAALLIKKWFESVDVKTPGETPTPSKLAKQELVREEEKEKPAILPTPNPPLAFQLRNLASEHIFFNERNISAETVKTFGLGFCCKGMMAGRVVIPIYDHAGALVAYCGRAIAEPEISQEKYKLPPSFIKSSVVFNLHRQPPGADNLILVESYLSVFRLTQAGFPHVVALMGASLSEEQAALIINFLGVNGRVQLLFDADDSGRNCTNACLARFSPHLFVKALNIEPVATKPHQASEAELKTILL